MSTATQPVRPASLTARVAVYPSDAIKPVPAFVFSVPDGWVLDEGPDALVVVHTPEEVDGFWVNLMVSQDRVARAIDHKAAAQATWARLVSNSPEAKVTMERMVRFDERITYLRAVELTSPKSGRALAQLHALFFAPAADDAKTQDVFQLIGTCPADQAERWGKDFLEVIGSFRFS